MNSFIAWIGGKRLLRKEIVSRFPTDIGRYVEVFGGAGWVLFYQEKHAPIEVYNDIDGELVNLFRCTKFHAGELQREIQSLCLNSRELFCDFKAQQGVRGFTDIQRAAKFFMLIKTSFGAGRRTFGCNSKNISNAIDAIDAVSKRLQKVTIENRDFERLISIYDSPKTLFYLDPPYHGTEKYYDNAYTEADHMRLNEALKRIKGYFILSYNDDAFVRNLYKDCRIEEISRQNNIAGKGCFNELIIRNFNEDGKIKTPF